MEDVLAFPHVPSTIRILRTGRETGGELLEVEESRPADADRRGPPVHRHPRQEESFEVIEGRMWVRVGSDERMLSAGESVTMPPGAAHTFRNASAGPLRHFTRFRPAGRMEEFFRIASALDRAGRLSPNGFPDLLDAAVLARSFRDDMVLVFPPQPVQLLVFGSLAPIGRLLGRARLHAGYLTDPPVLAAGR